MFVFTGLLVFREVGEFPFAQSAHKDCKFRKLFVKSLKIVVSGRARPLD